MITILVKRATINRETHEARVTNRSVVLTVSEVEELAERLIDDAKTEFRSATETIQLDIESGVPLDKAIKDAKDHLSLLAKLANIDLGNWEMDARATFGG